MAKAATPHRLAAPPHWRAIDFVSDLHLGPALPRTVAVFERYLEATSADAVLILGDLFEVWVGDDARGGAFEARCVQALARAARTRHLGFMVGNRDFLAGDALLAAARMQALPDPTLLEAFGRRLLLTHGDALCLSDVDYQRFRVEVRSTAWRKDFLAKPLPEREALARRLRDASEQRKRDATQGAFHDVDAPAALALLREARADALVHGHTHRPGSEALVAGGPLRHVLSDWDLDDARPPRAEVLRLSAAGLERLPVERAAKPAET